uniref:Uncharacterized protein n=1 Tax=Arundo donax TaxID=35708 RepID=A0A0A8Z5T1_ARUDO
MVGYFFLSCPFLLSLLLPFSLAD